MPDEPFSQEGRILAIDYGEKRIGLAISDPFGNFPIGLETLTIAPKTDIFKSLKAICDAKEVIQLVLGLPINMNGTEGPQAEKARTFAAALEKNLQLPVVLLDERLTSVLAHQTLHAQGIEPSRNKSLVDQAAAMRLLEDYLAQRKRLS